MAEPTETGSESRNQPLSLGVPPSETERAELEAFVERNARTFNLDRDFTTALLDAGLSAEQTRIRVLDAVAAIHPIRHMGNTSIPMDTPSERRVQEREAMVDQLFCSSRGRQSQHPLAANFEHCRDFSGLCTEVLTREGYSRPWTLGPSARFRALASTSDFPTILADALNKSLQEQFEAAQSPLMRMSRERRSRDFRTLSTVRRGEFPELEVLNESGEIRRGSFGEEGETYAVKTAAKIAGVTRQVLINDDLGAFDSMASDGAIASANYQAGVMVALLNANGGQGVIMSDGTEIFDPNHGNQSGSGGAIAVATLGAALQSMREQKGVDGLTFINIVPKYLLVPPALEVIAMQFVTDIDPAQSTDVNPFADSIRLEVAVEPRLTSATGWYVVTEGTLLNLFEHSYLDGASGPQIETREGWDVLGAEVRVVLDFGATAVNYRAGFYNAGA